MQLFGIGNCAAPVKEFVSRITDEIVRQLGEKLVGVYLHGSLVLDSFNPMNSDVDVLVITSERLTLSERLGLAGYFCEVSGKPYPVELSVIATEHLRPWQHPMPCQFHFSEFWKPKYVEFMQSQDYSHWILATDFTDGDIACHATLTKERGICLHGAPIAEVFPDVPQLDFWDSIAYDIDEMDIGGDGRVYGILSYCRMLYYALHRRIISKTQAAEWAMEHLPHEYREVPRLALIEKVTDVKQMYDTAELDTFKAYMLGRIKESEPR